MSEPGNTVSDPTITSILTEAVEALRRCRPIACSVLAFARPCDDEPGDPTAEPPYVNNLRGLAGEIQALAHNIEHTVNEAGTALGVPMAEATAGS